MKNMAKASFTFHTETFMKVSFTKVRKEAKAHCFTKMEASLQGSLKMIPLPAKEKLCMLIKIAMMAFGTKGKRMGKGNMCMPMGLFMKEIGGIIRRMGSECLFMRTGIVIKGSLLMIKDTAKAGMTLRMGIITKGPGLMIWKMGPGILLVWGARCIMATGCWGRRIARRRL
jgi:hypothetical protein